MTTKTAHSPTQTLANLAQGRAPLASVAITLAKASWRLAQGLYLRWRNREQIREMMELDDHLLCDMGITRYDVLRAGNAPLTRSSGEMLSRSAGRRYSPPRRPVG